MSKRISKNNPAGWVYILEAERQPLTRNRYFTKIGCSGREFRHPKGRGSIAEFWMKALGAGGIRHREFWHARAYFVEQELHRELKREKLLNTAENAGCGSSTESFNVSFDEAVDRVERKLKEIAGA